MISTLLEKIVRHKFLVFLCLIGCTIYFFSLVNRATVDLSIQVERRVIFKIYWAQENEGFSEWKSKEVLIKPGEKNYHFWLTNLRNVDTIRIDPQRSKGKSVIEKIVFTQRGIKPISYSPQDGFFEIKQLNHISEYHLEEEGLVIHSSSYDPYLVGDFTVEKTAFPWVLEFFRFGFVCLIIVIVYTSTKHLNKELKYVPLLMTVVLTLVLVMAVISDINVHPDEATHLEASKYYLNNWLPPAVEDPEIRSSYSPYGTSRLHQPEIYYLFAGKFAKLISDIHLEPLWLIRLFSVFLFGCLLFYTLKGMGARAIAIPFLISPQIWYVFSYSNSDAFALFISFLVGVQIVVPRSMFNLFLRQNSDRGLFLIRALLLGLLLGCLLLLKRNYYPFIIFILGVLAWQIWEMGSKEERLLAVKRLLILSVIGLSLFSLRIGADYYVNGFDRADKIADIRSELAAPLYNPQTELNKRHAHLYMKKRGVPLNYLIEKERFFEKSFRSTFGVYSYFTISAPIIYYDIVRWTGVALLVVFLGLIFKHSWRENGIITFLFLILSLGLIAASLHHSWTKDFQAQGRYLFSIVPMLSVVYARSHRYLNGWLFTSLFFVMFLLAAYSFIFVAIPQIPKSLWFFFS